MFTILGAANMARQELWQEYDAAADYLAARGLTGKIGDPLPPNLASDVCAEIDADPEAFEQRVRDHAYARAMNALNLPDL